LNHSCKPNAQKLIFLYDPRGLDTGDFSNDKNSSGISNSSSKSKKDNKKSDESNDKDEKAQKAELQIGILVVASTTILKGQEVTIDYEFDEQATEYFVCLCGNCNNRSIGLMLKPDQNMNAEEFKEKLDTNEQFKRQRIRQVNMYRKKIRKTHMRK